METKQTNRAAMLASLRTWLIVLATVAFAVVLAGIVLGHGLRTGMTGTLLLWFFFVPGLGLSFALFPSPSLHWVQRLCLALVCSLSLEPFLLFTVSRAGLLPFTLWSAILCSGALFAAGLTVALKRTRAGHPRINLAA